MFFFKKKHVNRRNLEYALVSAQCCALTLSFVGIGLSLWSPAIGAAVFATGIMLAVSFGLLFILAHSSTPHKPYPPDGASTKRRSPLH